jgi:hypothetical protein
MVVRGNSTNHGPPKALLDQQGLLIHSLEALLLRFSEHFVSVLKDDIYLLEETHM